jgi:hypothetical protein
VRDTTKGASAKTTEAESAAGAADPSDPATSAGTANVGGTAGKQPQTGRAKANDAPNVEFLEKRVETLERQVTITMNELGLAHAALDALADSDNTPDGADDEIAVRTSMLYLEIPEEPRIRKIIDAAEKKKPEAPKRSGKVVPPRPSGHKHNH